MKMKMGRNGVCLLVLGWASRHGIVVGVLHQKSQGRWNGVTNLRRMTTRTLEVHGKDPEGNDFIDPDPVPTPDPTSFPTGVPSHGPSLVPSATPSQFPSALPSVHPTSSPSETPTTAPSTRPSATPTTWPSSAPSAGPSVTPSLSPSTSPSSIPSSVPSLRPSTVPSAIPTQSPSSSPSTYPSLSPSAGPSATPSLSPSTSPSSSPSSSPSMSPSKSPSALPSSLPSQSPSYSPSTTPSLSPSAGPSQAPSSIPSSVPTISSQPSQTPSAVPTLSMAPTTDCTSDEKGSFGNTTGAGSSTITIQYNFEVETSTTNDTYLQDEIIPALEQAVSDLLLALFYKEKKCGERRVLHSSGLNGQIRQLEMLGLSANPADVMLEVSCRVGSGDIDANATSCSRMCKVFQGQATLFVANSSDTTAVPATAANNVTSLQSLESGGSDESEVQTSEIAVEETILALNAIQEGMNGGALNSAHSDICQLYFIKELVGYVQSGSEKEADSGIFEFIGELGVIPVAVIAAATAMLCFLFILALAFKNRRRDEDDSLSSSIDSNSVLGDVSNSGVTFSARYGGRVTSIAEVEEDDDDIFGTMAIDSSKYDAEHVFENSFDPDDLQSEDKKMKPEAVLETNVAPPTHASMYFTLDNDAEYGEA